MKRERWEFWADWLGGLGIVVASALGAGLRITLQDVFEKPARTFTLIVGGFVAAGLLQALGYLFRRKIAGNKDRSV